MLLINLRFGNSMLLFGSLRQRTPLKFMLHNNQPINHHLTNQAPVVQTLDSAIHWINHYPLDNSIGFASAYPLDRDLSGGQCYPSFEQLGPDHYFLVLFLLLLSSLD